MEEEEAEDEEDAIVLHELNKDQSSAASCKSRLPFSQLAFANNVVRKIQRPIPTVRT